MGEPLLFLLVAAAGMAVGLARGGSLRRLREPEVRAARLGVAFLAVQSLVVVLPLSLGGSAPVEALALDVDLPRATSISPSVSGPSCRR